MSLRYVDLIEGRTLSRFERWSTACTTPSSRRSACPNGLSATADRALLALADRCGLEPSDLTMSMAEIDDEEVR